VSVRTLIEDGRVHVFEGAMGTQLYDRGVFVNVCYDELNLTRPELVGTIHREYVEAGAEILKTNTFGANPVKLSGFGLEEKTEEINRAAARLAREAAAGRAAVVGAIGPLGIRIEPWGPTSAAEAEAFFRRQAQGLLDGGADGFLLETFSDVTELHGALRAVRSVADLPVFAQVTLQEGGSTSYGTPVEAVAELLDGWGADVVGINCGVGPAETLDAIERMARVVRRPLGAQPNAGLPRAVGNRKMYLASPAYMARYAAKMVEAGARFVGGCCGTTPDHVRAIAAALPPGRRAPGGGEAPVVRGHPDGWFARGGLASVRAAVSKRARVAAPLAERSALGRKLAAGEFVTVFELLPPGGWSPVPLLQEARRAVDAGAAVLAVAEASRGSRRMATIPSAILLRPEISADIVVRYTCRDRSMFRMISDLLGVAAAGIRNVIVTTGAPPPIGPYPDPTSVLDLDSIGLTNVLSRLNQGEEPGGGEVDPPTPFVVGVELDAGVPDLARETRRFRWKVDAGADFAVTRPVFDAQQFIDLLDSLKGGRDIPILAAVTPLSSLREAEYLSQEVPGVRVPESVLARMEAAEAAGPESARAEGLKIAVEVAQSLRHRVAGVLVSPSGHDHDLAHGLLKALGGGKGSRPVGGQ
jgi:homocysteine S-methyltransferase